MLKYTFTVRSNGVTIQLDPLLPGNVFDGYLAGIDLNFQTSKSKITGNWNGFGRHSDAVVQVQSGIHYVLDKIAFPHLDIRYIIHFITPEQLYKFSGICLFAVLFVNIQDFNIIFLTKVTISNCLFI